MESTVVALDLIKSARLSPTEHLLLKHFINSAVNSDSAAQYIIARTKKSPLDVKTSLRLFKREWRHLVERLTTFDPVSERLSDLMHRRDGPLCGLTSADRTNDAQNSAEPAYIIPPSLLHGSHVSKEGCLSEVFEAFLGPQPIARLQRLLAIDDGDENTSLQNIWLLSPSIHEAFRAGHVDVRPLSQPFGPGTESEADDNDENPEYVLRKLYPEEPSNLYFADGTEFEGRLHIFEFPSCTDKDLPQPSRFLLRVHYRFAGALHLFSIEDKTAGGWGHPSRYTLRIPGFIRQALRYLWLSLPLIMRLRCYLLLMRVGRKLYGANLVPWVQQVPFGLVIKKCIRSTRNEPHALRLVEQHTDIPAPRVIDVGEYNGATYLVMNHLRGQAIADVWHLMSYDERSSVAADLRACVAQLREIPNHTPYRFADTLGRPYVDHHIPDESGGPFHTEAEFNNQLISHLECTMADVFPDRAIRLDHRSYFTHSDFHPLNILVGRGRLSGLVDWECAGFKPEYWEFTKAMYSARRQEDLEDMIYQIFGHEYDSELGVERSLWRLTPFGV